MMPQKRVCIKLFKSNSPVQGSSPAVKPSEYRHAFAKIEPCLNRSWAQTEAGSKVWTEMRPGPPFGQIRYSKDTFHRHASTHTKVKESPAHTLVNTLNTLVSILVVYQWFDSCITQACTNNVSCFALNNSIMFCQALTCFGLCDCICHICYAATGISEVYHNGVAGVRQKASNYSGCLCIDISS